LQATLKIIFSLNYGGLDTQLRRRNKKCLANFGGKISSKSHAIKERKSRWLDIINIINGWIILRWISRSWDVGIWTRLGWPRIETGGGRL